MILTKIQESSDLESLKNLIQNHFSSPDKIISTFLFPLEISGNFSTIDCNLVDQVYKLLLKSDLDIAESLISATLNTLDQIHKFDLSSKNLGVFVVMLLNPFLQYPEHQTLVLPQITSYLNNIGSKERLEFQSIVNDSVRSSRTDTNFNNLSKPSPQAIEHFQTIIFLLQMFLNNKISSGDDNYAAYTDIEVVNTSRTIELFCIFNFI